MEATSPRAMISSEVFRLRALRVMKTFAASSGSTVATTRARAIAGVLQGVLIRRVGLDAEIAEVARLGEAAVAALQDDEGRLPGGELLRQHGRRFGRNRR